MFGWGILQLELLAVGERWNLDFWQQRLALLRGDPLIWPEQSHLAADDPLRDSALRLVRHNVFVTAWACSPRLSADHVEALDAARATVAEFDLRCGIAWLAEPAELLVIRALGHSGHWMHELFEALWHTLRPWGSGSATPPQRPRIWST